MNNMKALTQERYGNPDVLRLSEVATPTPTGDEVLVKIHASSINPADWHYVTGLPYLVRLSAGLRKPKNPTPGLDLAGTVEAVGPDATRFAVGDRVFGEVGAAYAEYLAVPEHKVEPMPVNVSFAEAAAVPVAGLTALQGLRDHGGLTPETGKAGGRGGQQMRVLINGASGGVGHFAVQIAKAYGAEVTGVCSSKNLELVRSIGADHVVDYTVEDYTAATEPYDIVFDFAASHSIAEIRRVMHDGSVYLPCTDRVGGKALGPLPWTAKMMFGARFGKPSIKTKVFVAAQKHEDMAELTNLIERDVVTPILDPRPYTLEQVPLGLQDQAGGHARGKKSVVIVE